LPPSTFHRGGRRRVAFLQLGGLGLPSLVLSATMGISSACRSRAAVCSLYPGRKDGMLVAGGDRRRYAAPACSLFCAPATCYLSRIRRLSLEQGTAWPRSGRHFFSKHAFSFRRKVGDARLSFYRLRRMYLRYLYFGFCSSTFSLCVAGLLFISRLLRSFPPHLSRILRRLFCILTCLFLFATAYAAAACAFHRRFRRADRRTRRAEGARGRLAWQASRLHFLHLTPLAFSLRSGRHLMLLLRRLAAGGRARGLAGCCYACIWHPLPWADVRKVYCCCLP